MVPEYWHLAVIAALVALVVWGFRASRSRTMFGLAVTLLVISGWLLYTLVLEETGLEFDLNSSLDTVAIIAIPAVLGTVLGLLAIKGLKHQPA